MWSKLFIILLLVHYLSASCDICQSGRAACHSENTYSICIDGVPTRTDITCPVGYTCTGEKFICYKKSEGYKPICISGVTDPTDSSTTPVSTTPASTTPASTTPVSTTPVSTTPVSTTPVSTTPVSTTPVSTTPVSTTPASTTPVSTTPVSTTPASTTPLLVHYLSASCDICQSGRAACHSENTYSICIDGVPTRNDITCPVGYTCTGEKFICYKKSEGYKPICISGETEPTDSTPKGSTPISSTTKP
ncbi:hypothetical protein ACLKA6_011761 [Drosophila palustris]